MILIVKQPNSSNTHTVVAYDYDSITWTINVHPGWRNEENNTALTHVSLKDLGYTDIVCAIGLDFYAQKNIRAKYHSSNGGDDCDASTFIFPREIEMKLGDNIDLKPSFVWKSLYRERWIEDKNPYLNFAILDSNKIKIFQKTKFSGWRKDYSDKIIMDPRTCNRDKKGLHNYNLFVGYYAVYPLNTLC